MNYKFKQRSQEPNMHFVPSLIHDGKRLRAIADRIYTTPLNGTFHQFLEDYAIDLIGHQWWFHQEKMEKKNQSIMFQHADGFLRAGIELKKKNPGQTILSIPCTGPNLAWMSLCYDLVCLTQKFSLPQTLIERLKINQYYQGARYEIAVGALMARAGFDLKWIDPVYGKQGSKWCEFNAYYKASELNFFVEVKSKHRPGVHNQKGEREQVLETPYDLLRNALKKVPVEGGFIIFIDLNIPLEPDLTVKEYQFRSQVEHALKAIKLSSETSPAPFSAIIFFNFPFHYGENDSPPPLTEYLIYVPKHPRNKLPAEIQEAIRESLSNYGIIPQEI